MGLFDFLTRKQRRIQALIAQYLQCWTGCVQCFTSAWQCYLSEGHGQNFDFKVNQTHKQESLADDLRKQIELELYEKALLPESRGDILGVLEAADRLLSDLEWVLFELKLEELNIPEELRQPFSDLIEVVCRCCQVVHAAVFALFVEPLNSKRVRELTAEIDTLESESDHRERALIAAIFQHKMGSGKKLLFKNLVLVLGKVSDRAEHVGHRIVLVSVKRRV